MGCYLLSKYIIGIDGGGTKTLGVLYHHNGQEIKRHIAGPSNLGLDKKKAIENIIEVIDALINPENEFVIQLGVAGYGTLKNKEELPKQLQQKYNAETYITNDVEIALHSVKKNSTKCVILVLGGTGSAIMYHNLVETKIMGGFGHLIGDEGSGYHLAISALKHIINQFEESQEITELTNAIMNQLNITDYHEIKTILYNSTKAEVAQLSKFLSTYAVNGNQEAIDLFIEEGKHIARQIMNAYNKMITCHDVVIAFRGGFLQYAPFVKETVIKELNEQKISYLVESRIEEPVLGAYYLGLQNSKLG